MHWPVSGPAFIHTVRKLSEQLQFSHAHSISLVGVGGVFVSVLLLLWGYRKLALTGSGGILVGLALSSYFGAPLMESRPQQWGQMLVFLGVICAWLWLHRQGGWAFFLIVPCIAVTHILSHAILVFVCGMLVIARFSGKTPIDLASLQPAAGSGCEHGCLYMAAWAIRCDVARSRARSDEAPAAGRSIPFGVAIVHGHGAYVGAAQMALATQLEQSRGCELEAQAHCNWPGTAVPGVYRTGDTSLFATGTGMAALRWIHVALPSLPAW